MKLYARIENEAGKVDGMGGNEYLDIDITAGNKVIARLTVRDGHVYNENDNDIGIRHVPVDCMCRTAQKQKSK